MGRLYCSGLLLGVSALITLASTSTLIQGGDVREIDGDHDAPYGAVRTQIAPVSSALIESLPGRSLCVRHSRNAIHYSDCVTPGFATTLIQVGEDGGSLSLNGRDDEPLGIKDPSGDSVDAVGEDGESNDDQSKSPQPAVKKASKHRNPQTTPSSPSPHEIYKVVDHAVEKAITQSSNEQLAAAKQALARRTAVVQQLKGMKVVNATDAVEKYRKLQQELVVAQKAVLKANKGSATLKEQQSKVEVVKLKLELAGFLKERASSTSQGEVASLEQKAMRVQTRLNLAVAMAKYHDAQQALAISVTKDEVKAAKTNLNKAEAQKSRAEMHVIAEEDKDNKHVSVEDLESRLAKHEATTILKKAAKEQAVRDSKFHSVLHQLNQDTRDHASDLTRASQNRIVQQKKMAAKIKENAQVEIQTLAHQEQKVVKNTQKELEKVQQVDKKVAQEIKQDTQNTVKQVAKVLADQKVAIAKVDDKEKQKIQTAVAAAGEKKQKMETKESTVKETIRKKAADEASSIASQVQGKAKKILHTPSQQITDSAAVDTTEKHSAYGGTNTIMASKNRFICLQPSYSDTKVLQSIKFTECHLHAECKTEGSDVHCVCMPGFVGTGQNCDRVNCGVIQPPSNGVVRCPDGTSVDKNCMVSCNSGYILRGPESTTCRASGAWSHADTGLRCERIKCSVFPPLDKRVVKACNGNNYGDSCSLSCQSGYTLEGNTQLVCHMNPALKGFWKGSTTGLTKCRKTRCGTPAVPAGATVNCEGSDGEKTCTIKCGLGFNQQGPMIHRCNSHGHWDGAEVKCIRQECAYLPTPKMGTKACSGLFVGQSCKFTCRSGYKLQGSASRKCSIGINEQATKAEWDGDAVTCARITCAPLKPLSHGKAECDGTAVGASCSFKCESGYKLTGPKEVTCRADATWSGKLPECAAVNCGNPLSLDNGNTICDGKHFGAKCKFSCKPEFRLVGSAARECRSNGHWSGEPARCGLTQCEQPPEVLNGHLKCTGLSTHDRCETRCNPGYLLDGEQNRKCGANGKFIGKEATCKEVKCEVPTSIKYGDVKCTGDRYSDKCHFKCKAGYELVAIHPERLCQSNGSWSGIKPTCKGRDCGELSIPVKGTKLCSGSTVDKICDFKCQPGYQINKEGKARKCMTNGEWSGHLSVCNPIDCDEPRADGVKFRCLHGTKFGQTCQMFCAPGHRVFGSKTTKCLSTGKWSGRQKCDAIHCSEPKSPKFGSVACTGNTLGKTCTTKCIPGYNLIGSETRTCNEHKQFSGPEGICVPVQCPMLPRPVGGSMDCVFGKSANTKTKSTVLTYDAACMFRCADGYNITGGEAINGSITRKCLKDGTWSGKPTSCRATDCGRPSLIPGCKFQCSDGTMTDQKCQIKALKGRTLVTTQPTVTCQSNGRWSRSDARCLPQQCKPMSKPPPGGSVSCTSNNYIGSLCSLMCTVNKIRTGPPSQECKPNHKWSHGQMLCMDIPPAAVTTDTKGQQKPAFSFVSRTGNVGVRIESLGTEATNDVFIGLQTGKKDNPQWMIGLLGSNSMQFCFGTKSNSVCAIRLDADGTLHLLGRVHFHSKVLRSGPTSKPKLANQLAASLSFQMSDNSVQRAEGTTLDDLSLVQLEEQGDELGDTLKGMISSIESSRFSSVPVIDKSASWVTNDGSIGVRLDTKNSFELKDAYFELQNGMNSLPWGIGMRKGNAFEIGYGLPGSLQKNNSLVITPDEVRVLGNVVFHSEPKYYELEGKQLKLIKFVKPATAFTAAQRDNTTATDLMMDALQVFNSSIVANGPAEPIVKYSSFEDVYVNVASVTSGDIKEAFVEMRSKGTHAWRISMDRTGSLRISHMKQDSQGGEQHATVIDLESNGASHFRQPISFEGKTFIL